MLRGALEKASQSYTELCTLHFSSLCSYTNFLRAVDAILAMACHEPCPLEAKDQITGRLSTGELRILEASPQGLDKCFHASPLRI